MSTVAIASASRVEDPEFDLLATALQAHDVRACLVAWDDQEADWSSFDATVIRSTWDYMFDHQRFVRWARDVEVLFNPADVVAWNSDKRYLDDLAAAGVPTIPTTYAASSAAARFPDGPFVVKPTVGGGSRGTKRFDAGAHDEGASHVDELAEIGLTAMVQPYVESVASRGETDVIVLDGVVSHAVVKHAPIGLDATAEPSGPLEVERVGASPAQLAVVAATLAAVPHGDVLCYARIDLVELESGPAVIEAELIEPFLFLSVEPAAPARLAASIARRLGR